MQDILIYSDEGACPVLLKCLRRALLHENLDRDFAIRIIDRYFLHDQSWEKNAALVIMPGGRDLFYQKALAGYANNRLRAFVEEGGSYLGLCAGAYYACASFEFEKGNPLEVIASRELAFFPGMARGPAYGLGQFRYGNGEEGARIAQLDIDGSKQEIGVYYNGGCSFVEPEKHPDTHVISRYMDIADTPAAIVECTVGMGRAILSGVHPEYSHSYLSCTRSRMLPELKNIEELRRHLFQYLLSRLGIL